MIDTKSPPRASSHCGVNSQILKVFLLRRGKAKRWGLCSGKSWSGGLWKLPLLSRCTRRTVTTMKPRRRPRRRVRRSPKPVAPITTDPGDAGLGSEACTCFSASVMEKVLNQAKRTWIGINVCKMCVRCGLSITNLKNVYR